MKRDFELCFCFLGGTFFFLEAKTINVERLLSYPKKGEKILKAIRSFCRHQKRVLQNNAIKLFSYLFIFPFCKIHATAYSLLFILFVDQGAFDLLQSYFLPILKIGCYFNALMIERKEVVFQVRRYGQFLSFASENLFSRKFPRFFSKLKFKENVFEATFVGIFVWVGTYIHVIGFIL